MVPLERCGAHHLQMLAAEGASPLTVAQYRRVHAHFLSFARESLGLAEPTTAALSPRNLWLFAAWLRAPTRSTRYGGEVTVRSEETIRQYQGFVKYWAKFLHADGWLPSDPLASVRVERTRNKPPERFTVAQVERLAALTASTREPLRNRAVVLLLYDTGLRSAETRDLKLADISFDADRRTGKVRLVGKGRKERTVYFGLRCRQALARYLHPSPPELRAGWGRPNTRTPQVFVSRDGFPLSRNAIGEMIHDLGALAGVEGVRCSPHTFRHTFATEYLRKHPGQLEQLRLLLGHSDYETVQIYARLAQTDVEASYTSLADDLRRIK